MTLTKKISDFFYKPFFSDYRTLLGLWVSLGVIACLSTVLQGSSSNNFLIFRGVFVHFADNLSLYGEYPAEYKDVNLYGPFFSMIIAPFAVLPIWLGQLLWQVGLSVFLFSSVRYLTINKASKIFIYWYCAHELLTALFMSQFNIAIAGIIILSFAAIEKEKDWLAALLIVVGTFVKIYGIVGLAFFLFSKHKTRFIAWMVAWSVIAFVLPMLFSSPEYVLSQYYDWFGELQSKSGKNLFSLYQNISILGMIRKISGSSSYSDIYPMLCGMALFALPYLRFKQYKFLSFKLSILASVLLFVVLFSTGSESSSYIIALLGVAIWYMVSQKKGSWLNVSLVVFAFLLTSMSPSDLFPSYVKKTWILPYALKALPCALIWIKLIIELCVRDYSTAEINNLNINNNE